jgi:cytoskeletal protein RodZ
MTDTNIASTTTPQATIPAPVADQSAPIQATATPTASVTATAAAATAAVNSPAMNGGGEQLPCQWVGCTEKSPTAEALYVRSSAQGHSVEYTLTRRLHRNTSASAMLDARALTT